MREGERWRGRTTREVEKGKKGHGKGGTRKEEFMREGGNKGREEDQAGDEEREGREPRRINRKKETKEG